MISVGKKISASAERVITDAVQSFNGTEYGILMRSIKECEDELTSELVSEIIEKIRRKRKVAWSA